MPTSADIYADICRHMPTSADIYADIYRHMPTSANIYADICRHLPTSAYRRGRSSFVGVTSWGGPTIVYTSFQLETLGKVFCASNYAKTEIFKFTEIVIFYKFSAKFFKKR